MGVQRLIWADSIKGWLIILVVLGHALQVTLGADCDSNHLWNIIYSFHMPAFMAISGYLAFRPVAEGYYHSNYKTIIIRRFRQLIVPFLLWSLVLILLNDHLSIETIESYILYPDKGLWFLWVLFAISIVFLGCNCLAEVIRVKHELIVLATCLLLIVIMIMLDIRVFGFQFLAYYFLFYAVGYFSNKYKKALITENKFLLIALSLCWFILAWFWKMHDLPSWLKTIPLPSSLVQYAYRFITAVIAVYIIISVSPIILNNYESINKHVATLGVVSLGIYTTHFVLIGNIVKLCKLFSSNEIILIASSFVLALVLSCIIVWLLSKKRITARLFLGKI